MDDVNMFPTHVIGQHATTIGQITTSTQFKQKHFIPNIATLLYGKNTRDYCGLKKTLHC
jgi:hypothetical protein